MFEISFLLDKTKLEKYWFEKNLYKILPKDFLSQTEDFRQEVEKRWKDKESVILLSFEEITGIKLDGQFEICILHPSLGVGQYLDEQKIEWGYKEFYPNYIVIGLTHELLHCLTHRFYTNLTDDQKWIFHAIIYLSIDEELRFKLNGKSEYFSTPIIETYHQSLIQTAKDILPYFKKYINKKDQKNIYSFYKEVSKLNLNVGI